MGKGRLGSKTGDIVKICHFALFWSRNLVAKQLRLPSDCGLNNLQNEMPSEKGMGGAVFSTSW